MRHHVTLALWGLVLCGSLVACGGGRRVIRGTEVPDTSKNRSVVSAIEKYRTAVERSDMPALLSMADKDYWDDAGTPGGEDDYGYQGLKQALDQRFRKASSIRYSVKYVHVAYERGGSEAVVDVLIDASYTIDGEAGNRRLDMRDQNRFVLTQAGDRWLFLSGM